MPNVKQPRRLAPRTSTRKEAAQRQGFIDGKEWAENRAHPSELSRIGFQFEVNKRLGYKAAFHFRGTRPGHDEFVLLIMPDLKENELREAAVDFWGDRLEVINGFGRFGLEYLKAFAEAALSVWLTIQESWEAVAYVRGVEAGQLWASTGADPEELGRLRVENERHVSWHAGRCYSPDIDDTYRVAEIILAPEPCDDECDRDLIRQFTMKFWGPIIGTSGGTNDHRITERRFVLGFVAGALGKEDRIWSRF